MSVMAKTHYFTFGTVSNVFGSLANKGISSPASKDFISCSSWLTILSQDHGESVKLPRNTGGS